MNKNIQVIKLKENHYVARKGLFEVQAKTEAKAIEGLKDMLKVSGEEWEG